MAEQSEFPGDQAGFAAAPPAVEARTGMRHELRPLTTGEILDRTFTLYRGNFWLFVGLSAIAAAISVVSQTSQLVYQHYHGMPQAGTSNAAIVSSTVATLSGALYLVAYSLTQAATTSAVSAVYLGEATSAGAAFAAVRGHWFRYAAISIWQIWSTMWIFLALLIPAVVLFSMKIASLAAVGGVLVFFAVLSLIYGVIAYIRNSLAIPAAVVEDLKVRAAMRRSKSLIAGRKGRVFLLLLLLTALYMVAITIQTPLTMVLVRSRSGEKILLQAIALFTGFLASSLIGPVGAIALCLFYIDERVRKEGFDIEFLMNQTGPAPALAAGEAGAAGLA